MLCSSMLSQLQEMYQIGTPLQAFFSIVVHITGVETLLLCQEPTLTGIDCSGQ